MNDTPEVKTERGPGQDLDSVTHHTHFVESWLTIEDDVISILHVPFNLLAESTIDIFVKKKMYNLHLHVDQICNYGSK